MDNQNNIKIENSTLKCDTPNCDWSVEANLSKLSSWVNYPCPKCGNIVFTETDFITSQCLLNSIGFVNKLSEEDMQKLNDVSPLESSLLETLNGNWHTVQVKDGIHFKSNS